MTSTSCMGKDTYLQPPVHEKRQFFAIFDPPRARDEEDFIPVLHVRCPTRTSRSCWESSQTYHVSHAKSLNSFTFWKNVCSKFQLMGCMLNHVSENTSWTSAKVMFCWLDNYGITERLPLRSHEVNCCNSAMTIVSRSLQQVRERVGLEFCCIGIVLSSCINPSREWQQKCSGYVAVSMSCSPQNSYWRSDVI